jgi:hypothetical protein
MELEELIGRIVTTKSDLFPTVHARELQSKLVRLDLDGYEARRALATGSGHPSSAVDDRLVPSSLLAR